MRLLLSALLILITLNLKAQHQAIGLRIGDPSGITYKQYFSNSSHAVEFGIGSVQPGWNKSYYRNSFNDYNRFNDDDYLDHFVESTLYLQGRWLKHYPWQVEGVEGSFEWYWGVGALLKVARVDYRFRDNGSVAVRQEDVNDIDLGIEIPLGMEYTFADVPLTLLGEFGAFVELANRPGAVVLKGAVGIRYNFFSSL
jgi:hypothetical protein